jgi:hypothetical protein
MRKAGAEHSDRYKMEIDAMHRVYIRIDGEDFNPDRFQDEYGHELGGSVGVTKRVGADGTLELARTNWKSEIVQSRAGNPEDELIKLLLKLRPILIGLRDKHNIRVIAQIVQDVSRHQEASGLFLARRSNSWPRLEQVSTSIYRFPKDKHKACPPPGDG